MWSVKNLKQVMRIGLLAGGKTGRDGVGGATGSSKVQTVESVENSWC